jgi:HSP20 family protein
MDQNDERFFEQLSGAKNDADSTYEVELTRASAGAVAKPKVIRAKEDAWVESEPEGQLTVDVYQTPDDIVVESAIAGVRADDLDVNVTSDSITIRGSRQKERSVKDEEYLYQECYWGKFARSIILPQEIDPESADVTFKNGILTVRLPKVNKRKAKKLRVRVE